MSFNNVKDQAYSALYANITAADTAFAYVPDGGAKFPSVPYKVVFYTLDPERGEVVQVTAQSGDNVTACVRGCDGTAAQAWPAGTNIRLLILASHVTELQTAVAGIQGEITTTPSADSVPKAYATAKIDSGWIPDLSSTYATTSHNHDAVYAPISKGVTNGDAHDHVGGDGAPITENALSLSDVATGNVSTSKHGFAPKAPNDTSKFLRGDGTWAVPSGISIDDVILYAIIFG